MARYEVLARIEVLEKYPKARALECPITGNWYVFDHETGKMLSPHGLEVEAKSPEEAWLAARRKIAAAEQLEAEVEAEVEARQEELMGAVMAAQWIHPRAA